MPSQQTQSAAFVSVLIRRAREAVSDGDFARAELLFRSADASELSVDSAIELGDSLLAWGRSEDARAAFDSAWERAKRCGDLVDMQRACLAIVRFHRECGEHLAARQFEQLAIRYSLDATDAVEHDVLLSLATGALVEEEHDLALRYAEAAGTFEPKRGDADAVAGVAMLKSGAAELSGERLYVAYRKHKKSGEDVAAATDLHFVGIALRSLGRHREAGTCHSSAARTWERTGHLEAAVEAGVAAKDCRRVAMAMATPAGVN